MPKPQKEPRRSWTTTVCCGNYGPTGMAPRRLEGPDPDDEDVSDQVGDEIGYMPDEEQMLLCRQVPEVMLLETDEPLEVVHDEESHPTVTIITVGKREMRATTPTPVRRRVTRDKNNLVAAIAHA